MRRYTIRIELTAHAKRAHQAFSERHNMTQVATMTRLIEWLLGQDELIQAGILKENPLDKEKIVSLILRRLSGK